MTTTTTVSTKRQGVLPKDFCERKGIKTGTALRVTEVGNGLYVTPIAEPTQKELKEVIAKAGSLGRGQTPEEEDIVQETIKKFRAEKRSRRR